MGFKFGNGFYTSVRVAKDQSYKRNTSNFRKRVLHTYLKMILLYIAYIYICMYTCVNLGTCAGKNCSICVLTNAFTFSHCFSHNQSSESRTFHLRESKWSLRAMVCIWGWVKTYGFTWIYHMTGGITIHIIHIIQLWLRVPSGHQGFDQ